MRTHFSLENSENLIVSSEEYVDRAGHNERVVLLRGKSSSYVISGKNGPVESYLFTVFFQLRKYQLQIS